MVENFFPAIDFVGVPVAMSLYGREKYKTTLGGVCSVLFSAFFIWSIYNTATEFFSTVNPKVVTYQSYTADPGTISVTNDAFPIGFALKAPAALDYILIKDETIFTIEIYHNRQQWIQNSNGTRTAYWTMSRVYTEDCPDDYFGTQETSLSTFNLSQVFCIAKEQPELDSLEIQGVLSSDVYQEIVVKVIACDTTTSSGVACASSTKISQYLTGSWFNAIYVNTLANTQNYTQPNNTFQDTFYTIIDPTSYREVEMQLGYTQINTDKGWIVEDIKTNTYLNVNDVKNFIQTTPASDNVLLNCVIRASQFETFYTRSYKKIQICIAEIWSAANLVLLIIIVLINPFLKLRFRELLMNELFDVQVPQKENKKIQKKKKSSRSFLDIIRSNSNTVRETDREENKNSEPFNTKMLTNLNTSQDRRGFERMNTSPLSTARPLISRELALEGRKGSSDNVIGYLNKPKLPLLKKSATIGPPNDSLWKRRMHSRTVTHIEDIQEETPIEEKESQNDRKLEEEMANINKMKMNLSKGHRKMDLISRTHVARKVKNKSLGDENSLHISCSSEDEEAKSEGEYDTRREERIEYREIMIPHLEKRIDSVNEDLEENKDKYVNGEKTQQDLQTAFTSNEREKEKEPPQKEVRKSITMSIWEYVYWFTVRPQSLQKKKEVHDDGIKKVNERLDIANLMKKLREIDKLRSLLLDKDQLVLFNNLPKPEIGQKSLNYVGRGSALHELLQDPRFIEGEGAKKQITKSYSTNMQNQWYNDRYLIIKMTVSQRLLDFNKENKK